MRPSGAHTHPEPSGSGIGTAAAIVLAAVVIAALAGPVIRAVTSLIEVLAIAAAAIAVLALAAVVAFVAWRARQGRANRTTRMSFGAPLPSRAAQALTAPRAPQRPALERPAVVHLHFHGTDARDVAAILRQHGGTTPPISQEQP